MTTRDELLKKLPQETTEAISCLMMAIDFLCDEIDKLKAKTLDQKVDK